MARRFSHLFVIAMLSGILGACSFAETKPEPQAEVVDSINLQPSSDATAVKEIEPVPVTPTITTPTKKIIIVDDEGTETVITPQVSSEAETIVIRGNSSELLSNRIVYFEFDSSDINDRDRQIIEAHSRLLSENRDISIVLEGHADERGSREYNIALGERRATGVGQLMELLGVSERQLRIISYGEERPAKMGHNEASWGLNRRAQISYR